MRFGVGIFHRLAVFLGPFGADFGTLLALFIDHLLTAQQFDECLLGAVALPPRGANDARIAAFAIAEARSHGIEKFGDRFSGHQIRSCLTARCQIALLAEGDHLLDRRTHGLRLDHRRLDALFHDDRRDHIAQHRAPM